MNLTTPSIWGKKGLVLNQFSAFSPENIEANWDIGIIQECMIDDKYSLKKISNPLILRNVLILYLILAVVFAADAEALACSELDEEAFSEEHARKVQKVAGILKGVAAQYAKPEQSEDIISLATSEELPSYSTYRQVEFGGSFTKKRHVLATVVFDFMHLLRTSILALLALMS